MRDFTEVRKQLERLIRMTGEHPTCEVQQACLVNAISISSYLLGILEGEDLAREWGRAMNELKPCPFCGGKAELDFAGKTFTYTSANGEPMDTGFFYTVKCCDAICGCKIGIYEDAEMAIEAWNRRASDDNSD